MNDKRYYWLKLKSDFFQQREIKKLRKIAGGDTYTIIYLKLQLLSLRNDCKLIFENIEDTFSEEMALEIDEDVENVKMTLLFLEKYGLIEEVSPAEFILPKTLENIGTETQGAERVRKHRDAKKLLQGNLLVTDCNTVVRECNNAVITCNTEKEKDLKVDLESDLKQEKKQDLEQKNSALSLNAEFVTNEELVNNKGQSTAIESTALQTTVVNKGEEYSTEFLAFWQQYPRKKEKLKAWSAWKTCLKEKCSTGDMLI